MEDLQQFLLTVLMLEDQEVKQNLQLPKIQVSLNVKDWILN